MRTEGASLEASIALTCGHGHSLWVLAAGWAALVWYFVVTFVCWLGYLQIQRHFSKRPRKALSTTSLAHSKIPHVTIIRPVKGVEPFLYECLAASIRQDYPRDKLTIYFCVSSTQDPAYPVLKKLLQDFPDADARVFVESTHDDHELGPNPKIKNMSRAYREAKGDIIWIADCNVWMGRGVCGRMVDRLCGLDQKNTKSLGFKFVHHLPIVVDVTGEDKPMAPSTYGTLNNTLNTKDRRFTASEMPIAYGGGRLEELFLSSSHAKMYSAINTVLIAPCVIGKSSMFRRSHLDYLTTVPPKDYRRPKRRPGIDYFSDNICEDHLIGDRLWKGKVLEEAERGEKWGKHSLIFGDLVIQPMSGMSVASYIFRRVRWLRVRKFTVILATLVEPGTESFLCSAYLAFGLTTSFPSLFTEYCPYLHNWKSFFLIWIFSILLWMMTDWTVYLRLHSGDTIEVDQNTPPFALPIPKAALGRRPFKEWFCAWMGREALALPIWLWSVYGGATVVWRDKVFRVGMDMIAHEVGPASTNGTKKFRSSYDSIQEQPKHYSDENSTMRQRTPNGSFVGADPITTRTMKSEVGRGHN